MAVFWTEYKFGGKRAVLRSAEPDDARTLAEFAGRLDGEIDFLPGGPDWDGMAEAQTRAAVALRRDMPNGRLAVAEVAGRIVAVCDALFETRERRRHIGEAAPATDATHWDVGRALLEESVAWLKQNGVSKINLRVDTENIRAIALYHHLGFVIEGRQERAQRRKDGTYSDAYWMGLKR